MAWIDPEIRDLLESQGYHYVFRRALYANYDERKAFSAEALQDRGRDWIDACLARPSEATRWLFFFNHALSPEAHRDLEDALDSTR